MEIFRSIIPVLFFTVINSVLCVRLKKEFGKCLPFTFLLSVFIMFFSQILSGSFDPGFYLLIGLFLVSLLLVYRHREDKEYIFTNGFLVFLCLCLIFLFINFGKCFFFDDEISHWGKMVKEMMRLDKFYYVNESTLRSHKDYPPFISLFEMLWCRLSLGYSECGCAFSLHIFEFGILLPFIADRLFENRKTKEKILYDLLLSISFIGIVIYLDSENVFNAIYTDTVIAMEFAYATLLPVYKETDETFGKICLGMILITMIMTKQVGIAFFMLGYFHYLLCCLKTLKQRSTLLSLLACFVMPVLFYFGWNHLISSFDIVKQFDLHKISISGFKEILSGNGYQFQALKLYVNALFKTPIYESPLPVTFLSSLLVEILLLELLKKYTENESKITLFEITCFVGTAGYAFMMLILYAFCYPEREAVVLKSYGRYMSSFICALVLCIIALYIKEYRKEKTDLSLKKMLILALTALVVFDGNRLLNFAPQFILGDRFGTYRNLADKFNRELEPGSRIYILYDHDGNDSYPAFVAYYSDEMYFNTVNIDLYHDDYSALADYRDAINELKTYDYMYVVETSESFNGFFSSLNGGKDYENGTLYRVVTNGELRMEKVE